jgi:hypothetical protein
MGGVESGEERGMSDELRPAKPPFTLDEYVVRDADGDVVLACSDISPPCSLWKDEWVPGAMCPKCGRLYLRMEYATPQDCGIEVKTTGNNEEIKEP